MENPPLAAMISAWSRETSLPASRRSLVSRRPIPNASFAIGTIRRPSASVTSRRASGMDRGEVYQNVEAEHLELVPEDQGRQGQDQEKHDRHEAAPPRPDLDRLPHRIRRGGSAAVADDGLVGDFSAALSADHRTDHIATAARRVTRDAA